MDQNEVEQHISYMKQMTQTSAKKPSPEKEKTVEKKIPSKPVKLNKDYQEMDDESDTDSEVKAITDKKQEFSIATETQNSSHANF